MLRSFFVPTTGGGGGGGGAPAKKSCSSSSLPFGWCVLEKRTLLSCGVAAAGVWCLAANMSSMSSKKTSSSTSDLVGEDITTATKRLKDLWAGAFDAWIDCPGFAAGEKVAYMRPVPKNSLLEKDDDFYDDDDARSGKTGFPTWLKTRQIFSLTACNPYGKEVEEWQNARANEKLKVKLRELAEKREDVQFWRSFGFSLADDWREDGFAVAFSESDATAEKDVVALAKQFEQGAIYRYRWIDEKRMERKTVGALMMDTEETVVVQICDKPEGLKNADST